MCAGATFVRADAREVDTGSKTVRATADADGMELEISYDKLIVAVGSQPNTFGIPGVREHGLFLKEAEDSAKLRARLLSNLEKAAALSHQGNRYAAEIHEAATSGCLASCAPRSYDPVTSTLLQNNSTFDCDAFDALRS